MPANTLATGTTAGQWEGSRHPGSWAHPRSPGGTRARAGARGFCRPQCKVAPSNASITTKRRAGTRHPASNGTRC
eukprot:15478896-Alexandrium_andersonii.AAC.3